MNLEAGTSGERRGFLKVTTLILIAFATAFFPRIIDAAGAPPAINFVHFAVVPLACGIVIVKTQVRNRKQISIAAELLFGLCVFLGVAAASALLNGAGIINVFLDYILLAEVFILLLAIVCVPLAIESFANFRAWALKFFLIHLLLALSQKVLLSVGILRHTRMTIEDNIQGVFYLSGGGHVVAASVSIFASLYYLISAKTVSLWVRVAIFFAAFLQLLLADAKQVLLVALVAWLLLILSRVQDIKTTMQYVIAAVIVGFVLVWCVDNLEIFRAYKTWIRPEIYGPQGDATLLKNAPLRIIPTYYTSFWNWLLGLGPGHTIGRLGGWMIKDYASLLKPLGATSHPVTDVIWDKWNGYYLDSSFFSPFWGFAGIWGDLGFLGLAAYLYLWSIVWRRLCPDDFSRFIVFNVMLNGFIFTLLEEPGFMLSVAILIGLRWQEQLITERSRFQRKYQLLNTEPQLETG
jgi:hypothetical protein